jgi:phage terminase large subunit GpA-like protein
VADEGIADRREACLNTPWLRPRGVELPVRAACIDTGGHHTSAVYSFVKPREGRRVCEIKVVGGEGRALVGRPSKK